MQAAAALWNSLIQRLPSGLQRNIPYAPKSLSDFPLTGSSLHCHLLLGGVALLPLLLDGLML